MNCPFDFPNLPFSNEIKLLLKKMLHKNPVERAPLSELKSIISHKILRPKSFPNLLILDPSMPSLNWTLDPSSISSHHRLTRKTKYLLPPPSQTSNASHQVPNSHSLPDMIHTKNPFVS
jgi:hypothetical protein